jgi:hypothetical protein
MKAPTNQSILTLTKLFLCSFLINKVKDKAETFYEKMVQNIVKKKSSIFSGFLMMVPFWFHSTEKSPEIR